MKAYEGERLGDPYSPRGLGAPETLRLDLTRT